MTPAEAREAAALLRVARCERLIEVILTAGLTLAQVRHLAPHMRVWAEDVIDDRAMPDLTAIAHLPAPVRLAVQALLTERLAESIPHHPPRGGIH